MVVMHQMTDTRIDRPSPSTRSIVIDTDDENDDDTEDGTEPSLIQQLYV